MIGINLLLVAWWSFAMWVVTRACAFVERKLMAVKTSSTVPIAVPFGVDDDDEESTLFDSRLSGLGGGQRVHRLAGIARR